MLWPVLANRRPGSSDEVSIMALSVGGALSQWCKLTLFTRCFVLLRKDTLPWFHPHRLKKEKEKIRFLDILAVTLPKTDRAKRVPLRRVQQGRTTRLTRNLSKTGVKENDRNNQCELCKISDRTGATKGFKSQHLQGSQKDSRGQFIQRIWRNEKVYLESLLALIWRKCCVTSSGNETAEIVQLSILFFIFSASAAKKDSRVCTSAGRFVRYDCVKSCMNINSRKPSGRTLLSEKLLLHRDIRIPIRVSEGL
eukprot:761008-Hanusia_phi.AAC.1